MLYIVPDSTDPLNSGKIYYSKLDVNTNILVPEDEINAVPYISLPLLIGAIYADDLDTYKCNMNKIIYKYQIMNTIYLAKTQQLYTYYSTTSTGCDYYYQGATTEFHTIKTGISDFDGYKSHSAEIQIAAKNIAAYNNNALSKDCSRIY